MGDPSRTVAVLQALSTAWRRDAQACIRWLDRIWHTNIVVAEVDTFYFQAGRAITFFLSGELRSIETCPVVAGDTAMIMQSTNDEEHQ